MMLVRKLLLASAIVAAVLSSAERAQAGPYYVYSPVVQVAPVPVVAYYPPPVVAYYPPVVAYAPAYYFAPVYVGRPAVVSSRVYYPGQPVRNALKVLAP